MKKKKNFFSIGRKMFIFVILTVFAVAFGTAAVAYTISADQIDRYYKNLSADNAQNFSTLVDPEYLKQLRALAESEEYQQLRDEAEENEDEEPVIEYIKQQGLWEGYCDNRNRLIKYLRNMNDIKYLYIVVSGGTDAEKDMYLLDDDENPVYETGYYEDREPELYGMDLTVKTEPTISHGDWGWLCSAYAPVLDAQGNYVCTIGCDFGMEDVMAERGQFFAYIIIGTLILTSIMLVIAVYVVNKTVVKPLDTITSEMERFKPDKNVSYKEANVLELSITSRDEIKDIYEGIRSMQINIIDYLNDLHTLEKDKKKAEDNIKSKEEQIGEISKAAYRDSLTGVGSKAAYAVKIDELNSILSEGEGGTSFAIVMIDLNDLKVINDTYGHKMGDNYIKGCCHLACEVFKHSPVFRIGGDEFVIILQSTDYENRLTLFAELKSRYASSSSDTEQDPWNRYSAAVGMADNSYDDMTVDLVFRRADKAMYEDKKNYKSRSQS